MSFLMDEFPEHGNDDMWLKNKQNETFPKWFKEKVLRMLYCLYSTIYIYYYKRSNCMYLYFCTDCIRFTRWEGDTTRDKMDCRWA